MKILNIENIVDAEYEVIDEVIAEVINESEPTKMERVPYRTMADVMKDGRFLPDKKQLYKEFWFENELCILFAEQGKGKTILAMQIAIEISKTEKILYLDYEMSDKQLYNRYSDKNEEFEFNENFIHPNDIFFDTDKENSIIKYITNMVTVHHIKTIFIDNISALSHQLESSVSICHLMGKLNNLKKEYGLSILLLGHTKKRKKDAPIEDNDLAGSKKLIALVDSAFAIGASYQDEKQLYVKQIKVRECEMNYGTKNVMMCVVEKFDLHLQFIESGTCREEELLSKKGISRGSDFLMKTIEQLNGTGLSNRQIAKKLDISEGTVRNYLKKIKALKEEKLRKEKEDEVESKLNDEDIINQIATRLITMNNGSNAQFGA